MFFSLISYLCIVFLGHSLFAKVIVVGVGAWNCHLHGCNRFALVPLCPQRYFIPQDPLCNIWQEASCNYEDAIYTIGNAIRFHCWPQPLAVPEKSIDMKLKALYVLHQTVITLKLFSGYLLLLTEELLKNSAYATLLNRGDDPRGLNHFPVTWHHVSYAVLVMDRWMWLVGWASHDMGTYYLQFTSESVNQRCFKSIICDIPRWPSQSAPTTSRLGMRLHGWFPLTFLDSVGLSLLWKHMKHWTGVEWCLEAYATFRIYKEC